MMEPAAPSPWQMPAPLQMPAMTRRELLSRSGLGLAGLALGQLGDSAAIGQPASDAGHTPLMPKAPPFPAKAKHVIHLFMNGGPSHIDTFDPKPALAKYAGKPLPTPNLPTERKTGAAMPSEFKFNRCGQSGIEVSEIFPRLGQCIDDICVIRSMQA